MHQAAGQLQAEAFQVRCKCGCGVAGPQVPAPVPRRPAAPPDQHSAPFPPAMQLYTHFPRLGQCHLRRVVSDCRGACLHAATCAATCAHACAEPQPTSSAAAVLLLDAPCGAQAIPSHCHVRHRITQHQSRKTAPSACAAGTTLPTLPACSWACPTQTTTGPT